MRAPVLFFLNVVAAGIHASIAGVTAFLLWFSSFLDWYAEVGVTYIDAVQTPPAYAFQHWFDYRPAWLVVYFSLVTALFHAIALIFWRRHTDAVLGPEEPAVPRRISADAQRHVHYLSWTEYSLSSSFMMVCLFSATGVREFPLLAMGFVGLWAVNLCGLIGEWALLGTIRRNRTIKVWIWTEKERAALLSTVVAWGIVLIYWAGLFIYFFTALAKQGSVPVFLWTLIFNLFFQFSSFGFIYTAQNWIPFGEETPRRRSLFAMAYVIQSLTAKIGLALPLVIGFATR